MNDYKDFDKRMRQRAREITEARNRKSVDRYYYPWLIELLDKHRLNPKTERTGLQLHDGWDHLMNTIGLDQLEDFITLLENSIKNFWDWRTGNLKTLDEKAVWIRDALECEIEECWSYTDGMKDGMNLDELK